ncbi:MAG: tetratricopeptide (TPR) repeat protein [Planctomycetota bacterium]|jgi:tetratricopeptide (TPR) repeat protein
MNNNWWIADVADVCTHFQVDLSCLVDGELGEAAATRAMAHLETCEPCNEFFGATRLQVQLHRDVSEPHALAERYSVLLGRESEDADSEELVHRLATIFYEVGKAYILAEIRPERTRVFEEAVKVEETRTRGRGFVDGVVARGQGFAGGVDWTSARGMFNGKLSKIEGALEKGFRLLEEALQIDQTHEEARLYLGFAQLHMGNALRAQKEFQRVFRSALDEANRGHAAVQLALMHAKEKDLRLALIYLRWVRMSRLDEYDERFFVVRFNIAMYYAHLKNKDRALFEFQALLEAYPDSAGEIAGLFAGSPKLRLAIDAMPGFTEELMQACPQLFRTDSAEGETIQ